MLKGRRLWIAAALSIASSTLTDESPAETGRRVPAGSALQPAIDAANAGDTLFLEPGAYLGPIVVNKTLTITGSGARLDGAGQGSVVRLDAPRIVIEGLTVQHSGDDLGAPDACVYLTPRAEGSVLRNNVFKQCAFGIWVHETHKVRIEKNRIYGSEVGNRSERGNGIQLFDATKLSIIDNIITGGRDGIYVSATEDSLIRGNRMERTRYGVHYMFSYDNRVEGNVVENSTIGYALMESHHIHAVGNRASYNTEHGILFRDVQYCTIEDNEVAHNKEGLFFFSSTENTVVNNRVLQNEVGAKIWAGTLRNEIRRNIFVGNRTQVFFVSASDLVLGVDKPGNYWGDYLGWDQDGDGVGDRPYRVDSFTTKLTYQYPAVTLLLRSPALELLTHLEQSLPLFRVPTVIDQRPLVRREQL